MTATGGVRQRGNIRVYLEESVERIRWAGQCVRCKAVHLRSTFANYEDKVFEGPAPRVGLVDGHNRLIVSMDHPEYPSWRMAALKAPGRPRLARSCGFLDHKTKGTEGCGGIIYEYEEYQAVLSALLLGGIDAVVAFFDPEAKPEGIWR